MTDAKVLLFERDAEPVPRECAQFLMNQPPPILTDIVPVAVDHLKIPPTPVAFGGVLVELTLLRACQSITKALLSVWPLWLCGGWHGLSAATAAFAFHSIPTIH